jgi:hypothetical protein
VRIGSEEGGSAFETIKRGRIAVHTLLQSGADGGEAGLAGDGVGQSLVNPKRPDLRVKQAAGYGVNQKKQNAPAGEKLGVGTVWERGVGGGSAGT